MYHRNSLVLFLHCVFIKRKIKKKSNNNIYNIVIFSTVDHCKTSICVQGIKYLGLTAGISRHDTFILGDPN